MFYMALDIIKSAGGSLEAVRLRSPEVVSEKKKWHQVNVSKTEQGTPGARGSLQKTHM